MLDVRDAVVGSLLPGLFPSKLIAALRASADREVSLESLLRTINAAAPASALRATAERLLARASVLGVEAVGFGDARYPTLLAEISDPPAVLWVRGKVAALERPSVAIVGSRAASPYALEVAERLSAELASRGVTAVSGLARGADSAAHRGALAAGGETVAVLGSGPDVIYPPEHLSLASSIMANGAIVTEFAPGTPPRPFHFPRRNRVISGLSLAVVVVEASERSGSLITADCALEQGREVMAVPGNVLTGRNRGSHGLLRAGAKIVETADDILEELGLTVTSEPHRGRSPATRDSLLSSMLPGETYDLDALEARSGLTSSKLLPRLLELELKGSIERVGGGRFLRAGKTVLP